MQNDNHSLLLRGGEPNEQTTQTAETATHHKQNFGYFDISKAKTLEQQNIQTGSCYRGGGASGGFYLVHLFEYYTISTCAFCTTDT